MLNSHIFDAFVNSTKTGSTLTGLPQKTFVEFQFPVPCCEEQKKISSFLDNLDNLITLHQNKCEKLKLLKKYMLQNMFPKKG
jgi:type I restriction enzyme S subunit